MLARLNIFFLQYIWEIFPLYRRKQLSRNQHSSELYELLQCMSSSGNTEFAISHLLRIAILNRWTVMISKGHGTEYASALLRTLWVFGLEFNFTFWLFSLHCGNFSAVSGCIWVFDSSVPWLVLLQWTISLCTFRWDISKEISLGSEKSQESTVLTSKIWNCSV